MSANLPNTGSGNAADGVETKPQIALIGYGEVGQILAADFNAAAMGKVAVWDRLFSDPMSRPTQRVATCDAYRAAGMAAALAGRTVVISAVTAGECLAAAREAAESIAPQAYYLDLNSVSPRTKRAAAAHIEAAGGRYIEAAVMSPIAPKRIASPMLIGGPHAGAFATLALSIGFSGISVAAAEIGRASATKMCRSVMIKGLEALLSESLLAARRYGVERDVLGSLQDLLPQENWGRLARYMIERSVRHGARRAEEMREAARTVADAGIKPLMSSACVERQAWAALQRPADDPNSLDGLLDAILSGVSIDSLECA